MKQHVNINRIQAEQPYGKNMVGYYAAWSANYGYLPSKIDGSKLTHVNYAFANINSDLAITMGYPNLDPLNFSLLNALKLTYPHLKTLISVGGWTWSGQFSNVALSEDSRTAFAVSCAQFIREYGFDGVDIDWEYPVSGGLPVNVRRPEDKQNFTLLLRTLREVLDTQGQIDRTHYLLTFAGGAGSYYPANVEMPLIHQYLDYGCIMSYDIHGTWDIYTDFNAPLFENNDPSPQYKWSVSSAVDGWLAAGFPNEKLVMGIPFYGYLYSSVNNFNDGLYQPFVGASSITYGQIASNYLNAPGFTRFFHPQSKAPWLFNGSVFISYDDPESIGYKTEFIRTRGLDGAMIWELSQDPNKILLFFLYQGLYA
jgi:chitinase